MFVDDEENILAVLKRQLRKEPYRVLTASSGTEGLRMLQENEVNLVMSDQRMPGMLAHLSQLGGVWMHNLLILLNQAPKGRHYKLSTERGPRFSAEAVPATPV